MRSQHKHQHRSLGHSPEREHRETRFADDDDGATASPAVEDASGEPRVEWLEDGGGVQTILEQIPADEIGTAQKETHADVVRATPLLVSRTAETVAQSPFLLETILQSGIVRHPEIREAFEEQRSKPQRETPELLQSTIESLLGHPGPAIALAHLLQKRIAVYRETCARLGGSDRAKIGIAEQQMILRNIDLGTYLAGNDETELDRLAGNFGIDMRTNALADALLAKMEAEGRITRGPDDRVRFKRGMIRAAFEAGKNLIMRQKHDLGHDMQESEEYSDRTLAKLERDAAALHALIDTLLQAKAQYLIERKFNGEIAPRLSRILQAEKCAEGDAPEWIGNLMQRLGDDLDLLRKVTRGPLRIREDMQTEMSGIRDESAPPIASPAFLGHAETALARLTELAAHEWNSWDRFNAAYVQEAKNEYDQGNGVLRHETRNLQAASQSETFRELLQAFDLAEAKEAFTGFGALLGKIADGTATEQERMEYHCMVSNMGTDKRDLYQPLFAAAEDPDFALLLLEKQRRISELPLDDSPEGVAALKGRLSDAEKKIFPDGSLHRNLQHTVSGIMNLEGNLHAAIQSIGAKFFSRADGITGEERFSCGERIVRQGQAELMELEDCVHDLIEKDVNIVQIFDNEEFKEHTDGVDAVAFFEPATDTIYLNEARIGSVAHGDPDLARKRELEHERGHRISLYFTEKSALVPVRLTQGFSGLTTAEDGTEERVDIDGHVMTYWELLRDVAENQWGFESQWKRYMERAKRETADETETQRLADVRYRRDIVNELFNQYASWCEDGKPLPDPNDPDERKAHALFQKVDGQEEAIISDLSLAEDDAGSRRLFDRAQSLGSEDEDDEDGDRPDPAAAEAPARDITDTNQRFRKAASLIIFAKFFRDTHPAYQKEVDGILDLTEPLIRDMRAQFNGPKMRDPGDRLEKTIKFLGDLKESMKKVDAKDLDLSNTKPSGKRGIRAIFEHVQFMSLYDFGGMFKEAAEDIVRMWKRRGTTVKSSFGTGITSWIPDWIPYAGQMKHEFTRRYHQSEIDEVEQWKKALENIDAFEMLEMLAHSRHKDQVKALIEKLSEHGRMDWNNEDFWHTLNVLSNYKMPIAACRRSDVLRDRWIQKLITDIWRDKDLWYNWRRKNDSGIDEGKNKFTAQVDQITTTDNLQSTLARILELYERNRDHLEDMPEDVNPHFYEKIITSAIENGKMNLEDKFFYLIQGVANGLLSIDRLRALGGEKGGIINLFPFIDYFDRRNNSLGEIRSLADKLREGNRGEPRHYCYGPKTTAFIHLVVTREESVRTRIRKGTGRIAEKIDHEDIHYIMPYLDNAGITELMSAFSGRRQKVTPEGLKNGWVGFANELQARAWLAKLNGQGVRFSQAEARDTARMLISYITLDNLATGNGTKTDATPVLSEEMLASPSPASNGVRIEKYRTSINELLKKVFEAYRGRIDWDGVNEEIGADPKGEKPEDRVTEQNFFGGDVPPTKRSRDLKGNVQAATPYVQNQFIKAVERNSDPLIAVLAEAIDRNSIEATDLKGAEGEQAIRDFLTEKNGK